MALYMGEDELWKCLKHPSKRRRNGVCATCLRDRLCMLCPHCATVRPCSCSATTTTTTATSSSSSFSLFSSFSSSARTTAPDDSSTFGRVGNLIESEPKFQKSRSVAIPFTRARFSTSGRDTLFGDNLTSRAVNESNRVEYRKSCDHKSFWSFFKSTKSRKGETEPQKDGDDSEIGDFKRTMLKSKSMRGGDVKASLKGKSWYFPSPIKVFRQRSKVVQDRSPLQR